MPGEHVAIMGPSGCGTSTLLHVLGGLEHLDSGRLSIDGSRVDRFSETEWALLRRRRIGFVFQTFNLIDELTALENVELPDSQPVSLVGRPGRGLPRLPHAGIGSVHWPRHAEPKRVR